MTARYILGNYEVVYDPSVKLMHAYKGAARDPVDSARTMVEAMGKIEVDQGFDKLKEEPKPTSDR